MKPTKCPAKEKKRQEKLNKRGGEKVKRIKVKTAGSLLSPKTKFFFLAMPELRKLIFCVWIRGPERSDDL